MKKTILLGVLLLLSSCSTNNVANSGDPLSIDASNSNRLAAIKKTLSINPDTIIIFTKGLCCPSCAIGIRRKVSKLNFIDQTRYNSGVKLDPKHQLVIVAIKAWHKADKQSLKDAVFAAGYDPAAFFDSAAFVEKIAENTSSSELVK